ncbi:PfkB family carbohydrate kinase [Curtobacterium pusillum]|uniref:Sugar kinase n=1 Tax=Curtobacterium pusillum TaxID=69373 RepID=A0ABX2M8H4_9MICO|nr:PfkB family carbohydrate kinase [Curtobacterium pusillum]NUU13205.1 sugar kinase [Curtobacterium pusillum]GLK31801.1 carbohydrate kinase [Curtobacterium pusillum]
MPRLVSVGNVVVDIVMRVDAIPEPGGDVIASASEITAGGGLNTMVAAARDGLDVAFAGQYGTGPFGDVVRAALTSSGVEVVQPGLDDVDSGYCVALVDATTERTFVTSVGAEGRLGRADLDRIDLRPDDTVFVSGYGLAHPVNGAAIAAWLPAIPSSVRVVFDPSPLIATLDSRVLAAVMARTDVVSANGREARLMAPGAAGLSDAVTVIAASARGTALARDGAAGCWVVEPGATATLVPGFTVDAVDSNGAGDAHDGVLVAALSRGESLLDAVRRANAAAALAVTRRGPATAPSAGETDAFLIEHGYSGSEAATRR